MVRNEQPDELYHYGRLGMKWYQHIFTKGTSGGGSRSGGSKSSKSSSGKITSASKKKSKTAATAKTSAKPKPLSEMSDKEIDKEIARMTKERQYKQLYNDLHPITPERESVGKKFAKSMGDALITATSNAARTQGQKLIEKVLAKTLGLEEPKATKSEHDRLKEEADMARYREIIRKAASNETDNSSTYYWAPYAPYAESGKNIVYLLTDGKNK